MFNKGVLFLLFLITAASVSAQSASTVTDDPVPWRLLIYAGQSPESEVDITSYVRNGYVPVGFEIEPDQSLSVLVLHSDSIEVTGWAISDYSDWNRLEELVTAGIESGFVPMDISRHGEAISVLWVRTDISVDGWRIHTAHNTVSARNSAINDFQDRGFSLWGVSIHDDLAWFLFLRRPDATPTGALEAYDKDVAAIQAGITGARSSGWIPYGLAVADNDYFVSYMR